MLKNNKRSFWKSSLDCRFNAVFFFCFFFGLKDGNLILSRQNTTQFFQRLALVVAVVLHLAISLEKASTIRDRLWGTEELAERIGFCFLINIFSYFELL